MLSGFARCVMDKSTEPKIYSGDGWTVINSRWQDSPPEVVDCCISDPPYDERTHKGGRRGKGWNGQSDHREISESAPKSFPPVKPHDVGPPLVRLARRWVILFCAVEQLGHYQDALGDEYLRSGIWAKRNPTPQFTGDRPGQWGDAIAICHRKGRKHWNGGGRWVVFNDCTVGGNNHARGGTGSRLHETEKPLSIMLQLVKLFSDPGELVWDPYAGSGTTGIACLRLGRRFLGHEMQPHYAQIAAERLQAEERGLTLQDARRGQTSILDVLGDS
jgi:site-specific DNA-methyltransferase (adenine-specific)